MKRFYESESDPEDDNKNEDCFPSSESEVINNKESIKQVNDVVNDIKVVFENEDDKHHSESSLSENTSLIPEKVENTVVEEEIINKPINDTNDANIKDCDSIKGSDVLDNVTVKEVKEIADNSSKTAIDNLNKEDEETEEYIEFGTNKRKEKSSMDYEFNFNDIEENHESNPERENTKNKMNTFEYTDLDKEIENFGSNYNQFSTESMEHSENPSKFDLVKESITNIKPKLTGSPDDVIDLETGIVKPNEVTKLMKRFAEHNFKKLVHKDKVELR